MIAEDLPHENPAMLMEMLACLVQRAGGNVLLGPGDALAQNQVLVFNLAPGFCSMMLVGASDSLTVN